MFTVSRSGRRVESVEYVDPADGEEYAVPQVTRHNHAGLTVIEEYNVTADGIGGYLNERLREFLWGDRFPEPVGFRGHHVSGDTIRISRDFSPLGADGRPSVLGTFSFALARPRWVAYRTRRIGDDRFPRTVKRSGGALSVQGPRRTCARRVFFDIRRGSYIAVQHDFTGATP